MGYGAGLFRHRMLDRRARVRSQTIPRPHRHTIQREREQLSPGTEIHSIQNEFHSHRPIVGPRQTNRQSLQWQIAQVAQRIKDESNDKIGL